MNTKNLLPLLLITTALLLFGLGCGSSGSSGPSGPHGNGEITILYCTVGTVAGETHVQWKADCLTRGDIRYGTTSFSNIVTVNALADSHDVVLSGLQFNTHYMYRLTVTDTLNRTAQFASEFDTPVKATPEPVINGFTVTAVTECTALLNWRTDVPATTILYYGPTALTDSVVQDSFAFVHAVTLTSLLSSTTYLLEAAAEDSSHLRGYGRDTSLVTAAMLTLSFPDTSVTLGDTIRLPIYVNNAVDLAALRVGLTFAPGSMEVIAIEEGPFYSDHRGFIFFSSIRNSTGECFADLTWHINYVNGVRTGTDADGSGVLAYARLRGLNPGATQTSFYADSTFGLDVLSAARICSLRAGNVEVVP